MNVPDDNYVIKVYCTVTGITEDAIYEALRSDALETVEEIKEQFGIIFMMGQRPLQIFKYQNEKHKVPNYCEQSYFLIIDSADMATDGVLLCNLEAEHGFADAVRHMPDAAGMAAASLGIVNTDWTEVREWAWYEQKPPVERFAIYDNRTDGKEGTFHPLAFAVDAGLHYIGDEGEPLPERTINDDAVSRYTPISLDKSCDLEGLVEMHRKQVEEKDLDEHRFVVVDDSFATDGALLVQVEPRRELRCKTPVAGELLYWYAIGFMNWLEIHEFALRHSDFEDPSKE